MIAESFDIDRGEWSVHLERGELVEVLRLLNGLPYGPATEIVWLRVEPSGRRHWCFGTAPILVDHRTYGDPVPVGFDVVLSRSYVESIAYFVSNEPGCTLYTAGREEQFVVRVADRALLLDVILPGGDVLPFRAFNGERKVASLDTRDFRLVIEQSTVEPRNVDIGQLRIRPFTSLLVADREVRTTVDWSRGGGGLRTAAVSATDTVPCELSFAGFLLHDFLGAFNAADTVHVHHDECGPDVVFRCGETSISLRLEHEEVVRWENHVVAALGRAGCRVSDSYEGGTRSINFEFDHNGSVIRAVATIVSRDSDERDRLRISTLLLPEIVDTYRTLREILQLEDALCDVRLSLQGKALWASIDVPLAGRLELGPILYVLASSLDDAWIKGIGTLLEAVS